MKPILFLPMLLLVVLSINNANAVDTRTDHALLVQQLSESMTVSDFLALDFKTARVDGKKLPWTKRMAARLVQKSLEKKVKKGKMEANTSLQEALKPSAENRRGRMSLIFGGLGLVLLFIPYVNIIAFGLVVAGFVLGLIGLSKDQDPTMAIIGTVLNGIILLVFLLAIAVVATFISFWN